MKTISRAWIPRAFGIACVLLASVSCGTARPRAAASVATPWVAEDATGLWDLDLSLCTADRGTGGLDPQSQIPDALFRAQGVAMPTNRFVANGFYFMGPGRILPECALRLDSPQQLSAATNGAAPAWDGPRDCSAIAWLVRDDEDLTIVVRVTDDQVLPGEKGGAGDAIELLLDFRDPASRTPAFGTGVFHLRVAAPRGEPLSVEFPGSPRPVEGARAGGQATLEGYHILVTLPLKGLGLAGGPPPAFYFDLAVVDVDAPGTAGTRLTWSGDANDAVDVRRFGWLRPLRQGLFIPQKMTPPPDAILDAGTRFHVREGAEAWESAADCSATAWVRRDADGIFVSIDVHDDVIEDTAANPSDRDGVELFFDLRPAGQRGRAAFSRGVFRVLLPVVAAGGAIRPVFGTEATQIPIEGLAARSSGIEGGYRITLEIPSLGLPPDLRRSSGPFNFDFSVNDADTPNGRESLLCWSGSGENVRNASGFGRLRPAKSRPIR